MPTTFTEADKDVVELVNLVMAEHHPQLKECDAKVGILMAYNPDNDAIKHGGYPVLACIKIVSARDRVGKGYDFELLIDQRQWEDELTPTQRIACIDHELSHIVRVPNTPKAIIAGELAWKTDDRGRPKLRTCKGDYASSDGFLAVIQRHGDDAIEYYSLAQAKIMADAAKHAGEQGDDAEPDAVVVGTEDAE
jgi:hypothetical protein